MPTQAESQASLACLVLAAGASRRMGKDKLSLPIAHGRTVLEQTLAELAPLPFAQRLVVVREPFAMDAAGFEQLPLGAEAELGLHRSLRFGLERVTAETVLIALADLPFVRTEEYRQLTRAYTEALREGFDLLAPSRAGAPGNPALIHRRYFPEIFAEPDADHGCRYLFRRHPERARAWETPLGSFFRDLDTPEDYQACSS